MSGFGGVTFRHVTSYGGGETALFLWQRGEWQRKEFRIAWTNQSIVQLLGRGPDRAAVVAWLGGTADLAALVALADAGTFGTLSGMDTPEGLTDYPDVRLDAVTNERWIAYAGSPTLFCTLAFWRQAT